MKPMSSAGVKFRAASLLSFLLLFSITGSDSHAGDDKALNILFVYSWHKEMPWQKEVERGFQQHFSIDGVSPNLYFEYMDAGRLKGQRQVAVFKDYLTNKYAGLPLDHVIFESEIAASLLERNPHLFRNTRTMVLNPGTNPGRFAGLSTVVPVHLDFETAIREMLVFSGASTVYLVGGVAPGTLDREKKVSEILVRTAPAVRVVSLTGLPMEQLLDRVANLDRDGIILYLLLFQDGRGKRFIPYSAASQISARANVPVYSFWTSLMGSGVVGGYMLSGERVGSQAAAVLMHPENNPGNGITRLSGEFHGFFFDWRQLKRWRIPESSLPPDSTVMFRQPNFYEEYFLELGISISVFILIILSLRYRELKKYNREIDKARQNLEAANRELSRVKRSLEQKNELLRGLSITDSLTGLYNRGYLDDKILEECRRSERYNEELSIILVDIDRFKEINDQYGHQIGDEVLILVAETLRQNIRSTDVIGRWGGEEFLIICSGSGEQQSVHLAGKLRELVESTRHEGASGVTCSFGVASHMPGTSEARLIKDADKALYVSKKSGRNCVTAASGIQQSEILHQD